MRTQSPEAKAKERARKKLYYQARKAGDPRFAPAADTDCVIIPNFKTESGEWGKTKKEGSTQYRSFSYETWKRIRYRCTPGSRMQIASPNYTECFLHPDFEDFQKFTDWHVSQIGFGLVGYDIDKDLLVRGNKMYGPDTCIMIPGALNSFIITKKVRGLPRGVRIDPRNGRFRAEMRAGNRFKYIGRFDSAEEASDAYRAAKKVEAIRWVERLKSGEFVIDPRVIEAMERWEPYV